MDLNLKLDRHMHTTVSDGSDKPEEILENVRNAGIEFFSVTDHDAVKGCRIVRENLKEGDPMFINGAEFSCKDEHGKYHILGYNYDQDSESIQGLVDLGHSYRMTKVTARLEYIKEKFGFTFPQEEIDKLLSMDNPGKPHIGNLMVKYGYANDRRQAIREYIDGLRFKLEYVRPEEAIESILGAGGIPVLAHPSYGSGDQVIVGEEMDERLKRLIDFGLQGVEAYYSGFSERLTGELLGFAKKYDLYVTAGSDYHGKNKLVVLGDTGCFNKNDVPDGLVRFVEAVGISV
ncbi:MAG: PHP domain-containing protein [Firmicutes bacterium]|nr:PHP domain-containing protein [Bacillota bacterium]